VTVRGDTPGLLESRFAASYEVDGKPQVTAATPLKTEIKPLALKVTVDPSELLVTQNTLLSCIVRLENQGRTSEDNVKLTLRLPAHVRYAGHEADPAVTFVNDRRTLEVDLPKLDRGQSKRIQVRVTAAAAGKGNFVAELESKSISDAAASASGNQNVPRRAFFESEVVVVTAPKPVEAPPVKTTPQAAGKKPGQGEEKSATENSSTAKPSTEKSASDKPLTEKLKN